MIQQLIINGVISGGIYTLIALSFVLIYRTVRFFHFAHGAVYAVGAYVAYTLMVSIGAGIIVSLILAAGFAGLVGVVIDRFIYKPLRKRKATNLIFMIASFGIFIVLQNALQLIYGAQTFTLRNGAVTEGNHFLGAIVTNIQLLVIVTSFGLCVSLWLFMKNAKLGKAMRAVASDSELATVSGVNSNGVVFWAFAIGSALAGLAGIIISLETNIGLTMGMQALMMGVIAVIIGGVNSIPGIALGALLLGMAQHFGAWYIGSQWQDAIAFVILVLFLLFKPEGFFGKKVKSATV